MGRPERGMGKVVQDVDALNLELADQALELFALEAELRGSGCGLLGALR